VPSFRYTAISAAGTVQQGVLDAPDQAGVIRALQDRGSTPLRAELAEAEWGGLARLLGTNLTGGTGLSRQQVAEFIRGLAVMLGAGLDLDRALRFLVETAPNRRIGAAVERIRSAVRDGGTLTSALSQQPDSFPPVLIGMVRAGEAGGKLAETLDRLAGLLDRQRTLAGNIRAALVYPVVLVVAALASVTLLLTQVLPQFTPIFAQNGAALPGPTQFLVDAGAFLSDWGVVMLVAFLIVGLAIRALLRRPGPRLAADRVLLGLPVLGSLLKEVLAARFARTFGTLLTNGVPLVAALDVARDTLGNPRAAAAVDRAIQAARGGEDLSPTLAAARVFPARLPTLLRLGHETAQLGPMALRAADIHEEAARLGLQRLVSLLVPAITIIMGAVIAGIVASLLLAMLSLNDLAGS